MAAHRVTVNLPTLDDLSDVESDTIWAEEAERRNTEMDHNEHLGRSAEDVLRDLRARRP